MKKFISPGSNFMTIASANFLQLKKCLANLSWSRKLFFFGNVDNRKVPFINDYFGVI